MVRSGIIGMLLLCSGMLHAQQDSVVLNEILIRGMRHAEYLAGSRVQRVDSSVQNIYASSHLGELLSAQFPVYFRNYGNGMLSGISLRGTAPQHTAVVWNGININSYSLGQADFSILPAIAFDNVSIHAGGGSARFGSGAFGGTVLLTSNQPKRTFLNVRQEVGSFGRYFTSLKVSHRVKKFSLVTSVYRIQSKNDFYIPKIQKHQHHAAFWQQGWVQNLTYTISKNQSIQANYWFHQADREIQPVMNNPSGSDEQQDKNHRLVINYQHKNQVGTFQSGAGFVKDELVYNKNPGSIERWLAFTNYEYQLPANIYVQASTDWNHIIGKIDEYGMVPREDRVDVMFAVRKEFNYVNLSLNVRKPFITEMRTPLLPYIGADVWLWKAEKQSLQLSTNASRNFRAPTFNDRYWQDLGNTNLLPERSKAAETSLLWTVNKFTVRTAGFYQLVDQWILWSPDLTGMFRPDNVRRVEVRGFETQATLFWRWGIVGQSLQASYQYTRSTTLETSTTDVASVGEQLIYTPVHTGTFMFLSEVKDWAVNIVCQYAGERLIDYQGIAESALDPYVLTDVSIGKQVQLKRHTFQAMVAVKNLLNVTYQQYSMRAMPGVNVNLSIVYQLNPIKS